MAGVDLFSRWPSIRTRANTPDPLVRRTSTLDCRRSTVLDRIPGQARRRRADVTADNPARFLQILIESISGKPLSSFFPVAQGIPKIIGVDGLVNPAAFDSFLEAFHQAMQFFILPNQPAVRQDDGTRRRLRASALGVRDAGNVREATPRVARKFDEFLAQMPPTPSTLAAALAAGSGDGIPLGFAESLSAFIGAMRAAIMTNDVAALHTLGSDFGSLLAALHELVNGGEGTEKAVRVRGGRPVLVRKLSTDHTSRAIVKHVDFDVDDFVYNPDIGSYVRRKRKKKLTKV